MSGLEGPIVDFGLLIIGAMIIGSIALLLRQPLILAYIVAGILLGNQGFGLIHDPAYLYSVSSELGIAMLLFVVGLELSFKKMLEVRQVVTIGTLAHTILLLITGMFAGYFLGFSFMESVYIGLIMAFSSTLLVVKALGEKHQVDTLAGRIMIGMLVFEDILVIIAISVLGIVAGIEPTGFVKWFISLPGISFFPYIKNIALLVGALLLLLFAYLTNRYLARYLFKLLSKSAEMLFVCSLGFLFFVAFVAYGLGFSISIGAFIAGVIVANTDYYLEVLGRIRTLASFFALLFFATLGFQVKFTDFSTLLMPIIVISGLVLVLKPLLTAFIIRLFGYDNHTSLLSGLYLSQISEFSLILVAIGTQYGHVRSTFLTITILVLLITFAISMYFMNFSAGILRALQLMFPAFKPNQDFLPEVAMQHADVVLYGVEHIDEPFFDQIRAQRPHLLVIDPDPETLAMVKSRGTPTLVGSLGNEEILEKLNLRAVKLIVSTVPDYEQNLLLCEHVRRHSDKIMIIVATGRVAEALSLYEQGASYVHVASFMDDAVIQGILLNADTAKLEQQRRQHIERLRRISARRGAAVDIEDFMSNLASQPIRPVRKVLSSTKPVFHEVDKFVRGFNRRK